MSYIDDEAFWCDPDDEKDETLTEEQKLLCEMASRIAAQFLSTSNVCEKLEEYKLQIISSNSVLMAKEILKQVKEQE